MRPEWDYTDVATAYLKRPPYSDAVLEVCWQLAGVAHGMRACDVGAGTGTLTLPLLERGLAVVAIEPNEAMRRLGKARIGRHPNVRWVAARAEATGQPPADFDLVTFGSSFNVVDRTRALREAARMLRPGGWFVCLWNHRKLEDPLQARIEVLIRSRIGAYRYGSRRVDQTAVIARSGLFAGVHRFEGVIIHRMTIADCLEAWRSHLTLRRQAGNRFPQILTGIRSVLERCGRLYVDVPYTTRLWMAQKLATTRLPTTSYPSLSGEAMLRKTSRPCSR